MGLILYNKNMISFNFFILFFLQLMLWLNEEGFQTLTNLISDL